MAGDFLYVTGQGMRDASGASPESAEDRVRQCLRNVKSVVEAAGLTMDHVVYAQVYLHSSVGYPVLGSVWKEFFKSNPPARATLGVQRMPTDTTVEINAVAVRDLAMKRPVNPAGWAADNGISAGVMAGDRFYVSGLLGRDPKTGRIPDDPAAQVQLSLDRIKEVLAAAGLDFRHMVFVNPYLTSSDAGAGDE